MANRKRMAQADLRRVTMRAQVVKRARGDLEAAIRDARASGETYRDIAAAAGMSYQRVWQLLNEAKTPPPQVGGGG